MKKVLQEIVITHLASIINKSFLKKLESISTAILSMRGRITMLGISRWNERYSYKTIERFFSFIKVRKKFQTIQNLIRLADQKGVKIRNNLTTSKVILR
jgi:hypothetical protein